MYSLQYLSSAVLNFVESNGTEFVVVSTLLGVSIGLFFVAGLLVKTDVSVGEGTMFEPLGKVSFWIGVSASITAFVFITFKLSIHYDGASAAIIGAFGLIYWMLIICAGIIIGMQRIQNAFGELYASVRKKIR